MKTPETKEIHCVCCIQKQLTLKGTDGSFQPALTITIALFIVTALPHQAGL